MFGEEGRRRGIKMTRVWGERSVKQGKGTVIVHNHSYE